MPSSDKNSSDNVEINEDNPGNGHWRLHHVPNYLPFDRNQAYEAAFMSQAEDNVYSRDPLSLPRKYSIPSLKYPGS
jgi:hypothetical protein